MHNHAPAGYICPLCLIATGQPTNRGNQEADVVWRGALGTVFIAGKWWRASPRHAIVIPNQHIENLYDMPAPVGYAMFDLMQITATALKETYRCDGTSHDIPGPERLSGARPASKGPSLSFFILKQYRSERLLRGNIG